MDSAHVSDLRSAPAQRPGCRRPGGAHGDPASLQETRPAQAAAHREVGRELASVLQLCVLVSVAELGVSPKREADKTYHGDTEARRTRRKGQSEISKAASEIPSDLKFRIRIDRLAGPKRTVNVSREYGSLPFGVRSGSGIQKKASPRISEIEVPPCPPCLRGRFLVW